MQNGTHKSAPANPLVDVMEALQEEVDDMVLGFEANLTRVKNAALDMFSEIGENSHGLTIDLLTSLQRPRQQRAPILNLNLKCPFFRLSQRRKNMERSPL